MFIWFMFVGVGYVLFVDFYFELIVVELDGYCDLLVAVDEGDL